MTGIEIFRQSRVGDILEYIDPSSKCHRLVRIISVERDYWTIENLKFLDRHRVDRLGGLTRHEERTITSPTNEGWRMAEGTKVRLIMEKYEV